MAEIYLTANDKHDGSIRVEGRRSVPRCVQLTVTRFAAQDGIGFSVDFLLSVDRARELARELEREADRIADASDLPDNARVVQDSAGFEPEPVQ